MADILLARQREINTTFADSGITALESVQAKRAALATTNAGLWARYGDGGTFSKKRDILYAVIAVEKRAALAAQHAKVTEPMVDAAVLTDLRYINCINDAEDERTRFYVNNDAIKSLDEKMFRDNAVIRYLTTEPKV